MDVVSREKRSRMMAGIRGKDTKPEILVRKVLFSYGYRFRLHRKDLPGAPDIVLPGRRIAIFVHGCFWHQHAFCRLAKLPATNSEFWRLKLEGNVRRDAGAVAELLRAGWRVVVVWECATRDREFMSQLGNWLADWIEGGERQSETPLLAPVNNTPDASGRIV